MNLAFIKIMSLLFMMVCVVSGQRDHFQIPEIPFGSENTSGNYFPETLTGDTIRYSYSYYNEGNVASFLVEVKHDNNWENSSYDQYSYNNNGLINSYSRSIFLDGIWQNYLISFYVYDENSRLLYVQSDFWVDSLNTWQTSSKTTYYYDESGNPNVTITAALVNNNWVNTGMSNYTFDNFGRKTSWITQYWNDGWVNQQKRIYVYLNSTSGKLTNYEYANWLNNEWKNSSRNTWEYDANGKTLRNASYSWVNNEWKQQSQTSMNYNGTGLLTSLLTQKRVADQWVDYSKAEYSNDVYGNNILGKYYLWSNNSWMLSSGNISLFYNNAENSHNIQASMATATYMYITSADEAETTSPGTFSLSQNFPNPFNPVTTISFTIAQPGNVNLVIFDVLGNKITTVIDEEKIPGKYEVKFEANNLPSGIYFYRMQTDNIVLSRKMILLK